MARQSTRPPSKPLSQGPRCYLCVGPNCWGKAFTAKQAEQNARSSFSRSLGGPWKFIMYDAPADCVIDEMGRSTWTPSYYDLEQQRPAIELYRYDPTPAKSAKPRTRPTVIENPDEWEVDAMIAERADDERGKR